MTTSANPSGGTAPGFGSLNLNALRAAAAGRGCCLPRHGSTLVKVDTGTPHLARVWNYWLGGRDYFPVDREAGDQLREACPVVVGAARDVRDFVGRAVAWLAAGEGVRQFLDVGGGLPMVGETHQVAQRVAAGSRVVYVESGRVAPARVRELLGSGPDGATRYVEGGFRDPAAILRAAAPALDLGRPVAFMLLGLAGTLGHGQEVSYVIRRLMGAAVPGSYLVLAEGSAASPSMAAAAGQYAATGARIYYLRDRQQLRQLFDGLELVPPGVVPTPDWHPARPSAASGAHGGDDGKAEAYSHCGVGRKPSS